MSPAALPGMTVGIIYGHFFVVIKYLDSVARVDNSQHGAHVRRDEPFSDLVAIRLLPFHSSKSLRARKK